LSQKLAFGVGAQGPMTSSEMGKPTPIMTSSTTNKYPKFPFFKNQNYKSFCIFRGFEQLFSLIAW